MSTTKPTILLAIHGRRRSGKDTLAKMLTYYTGAANFAFADKLKELASVIYDVPLTVFYDDVAKDCEYRSTGTTPRQMLKDTADMIKARHGDNYFARRLYAVWGQCQARGQSLIVTDLRHDVEADVLLSLGSRFVHITRKAADQPDDHISEQPLNRPRMLYHVPNEGDKRDLLIQARLAVTQFWGPDALQGFPHIPEVPTQF